MDYTKVDYRIFTTTLQGLCANCDKPIAQCPSWEVCYEKKIMSDYAKNSMQRCRLCSSPGRARALSLHAGACISVFSDRIRQLRRLYPNISLAELATPGAIDQRLAALSIQQNGASTSSAKASTSTTTSGTQTNATDIRSAVYRPTKIKITAGTIPRKMPEKKIYKEKLVQAQPQTKTKAAQTTAIELVPGADAAFVKWTGDAQAPRNFTNADLERVRRALQTLADLVGRLTVPAAEEEVVEEVNEPSRLDVLLDELEELGRNRHQALVRATEGNEDEYILPDAPLVPCSSLNISRNDGETTDTASEDPETGREDADSDSSTDTTSETPEFTRADGASNSSTDTASEDVHNESSAIDLSMVTAPGTPYRSPPQLQDERDVPPSRTPASSPPLLQPENPICSSAATWKPPNPEDPDENDLNYADEPSFDVIDLEVDYFVDHDESEPLNEVIGQEIEDDDVGDVMVTAPGTPAGTPPPPYTDEDDDDESAEEDLDSGTTPESATDPSYEATDTESEEITD